MGHSNAAYRRHKAPNRGTGDHPSAKRNPRRNGKSARQLRRAEDARNRRAAEQKGTRQ